MVMPMLAAVSDSSPIEIAKPVQPVSFYPMHTVSLVNSPIDIGFGRRHGDGSCVNGCVDSQIGIYDDVSRVKAICKPG